VARTEHEAIVRMADGEDLLGELMKLPIGSGIIICGIGMLRDIELGYWTGRCYEKHRLDTPVELVSLQGNLAQLGKERIAHLHACVAKRDGSALGGHLFCGTVHNTAEIAIQLPSGIVLERREEKPGQNSLRPRLKPQLEDAS